MNRGTHFLFRQTATQLGLAFVLRSFNVANGVTVETFGTCANVWTCEDGANGETFENSANGVIVGTF